MDLVAERAEARSSRRAGSGRNRQTAGLVTVTTMFVSVVVALVVVLIAAATLEREASMALISPGGPTVVESVPSSTAPAVDDGAAPVVGPEVATTTTGSQSGAAASAATTSVTSTASSAVVGERGRRALEQISYPWQEKLPGWVIEFDDGRDGLFGLTLVDDRRIEIYVRDDQSDDLLVHIVAHELGHAVDVTLNNGADRRAWQHIRGIEDEPWWPSSAASDFSTGAGDFAESFAYWQAESDNFRSKLGPAPSGVQLEVMANLAFD